MAKQSSNRPPGSSAAETEGMLKFFVERIEHMLQNSESEPINQIPNVDMYSSPSRLTIEVEMPGVRREDIDVAIYRNTLIVKGLKYECFEDNKVNYVCMERTFGRIYRAIEFPFPVDTVRIKAVYKDGILHVTMPRVEDKRGLPKSVPVETKD
ncbi:MAG TPA: Hsp20/alpha crystallin family protein [Deltaproteobacteria bacterium]|nr:Hsp20/alpha crystallin family protein [Deltaproteobacteria bacterium]